MVKNRSFFIGLCTFLTLFSSSRDFKINKEKHSTVTFPIFLSSRIERSFSRISKMISEYKNSLLKKRRYKKVKNYYEIVELKKSYKHVIGHRVYICSLQEHEIYRYVIRYLNQPIQFSALLREYESIYGDQGVITRDPVQNILSQENND